MNQEVEFYRLVMQRALPFAELRDHRYTVEAIIYIDFVKELGRNFDISEIKTIVGGIDLNTEPDKIISIIIYIERILTIIKARNIHYFDDQLSRDYVVLDQNWKEKALSLLSHVREHVRGADIPEGLRESIFQRLADLQSEIERNRTRIAAAGEALAEICSYIGKGAENLTPAVRLLERITGAFRNAQKASETSSRQRALPPPETLGLSSE